jgi:hypothetical protein
LDHGLFGLEVAEVESAFFSGRLQREEIPAEKGMGKGVEENRQVANRRAKHQRPRSLLLVTNHAVLNKGSYSGLRTPGSRFPAQVGAVLACYISDAVVKMTSLGRAGRSMALGTVHADSSGNVPSAAIR